MNPHETSAPNLPQDVIQGLLDRVPQLTDDAQAMLAPVSDQKDVLRKVLLDDGRILPIPNEVAGRTLVAVDGAPVMESLYAADLLGAVAVAAEGLNPPGLTGAGDCAAQSTWVRFLRHDSDLDRLAKAAMMAQELALLRGLSHDVCILDGSHQTAAIVFNSVLTSQSDAVRQLGVEVCREFDTPGALADVCHPKRGQKIVASPKSDSSTFLADYFGEKYGMSLPVTDKFLAAMVLEPGEMIRPIPPQGWDSLHIQARNGESMPEPRSTGEVSG